MVVCPFQLGAADFKCSPQSAQLAIESGKSHLHSVHRNSSCFPRQVPKVCDLAPRKQKSKKGKLADDTPHIILVEARRGQISLAPPHCETPLLQCSTLSFTFFIARGRPLPQPCHCGFCSRLVNSSALVRGSFRGNIGVSQNATLRLLLAMKSRRGNCVALYVGIFGGSAPTCFAA